MRAVKHQHCQTFAEIWHGTADEGALQLQPAMHLNFWGMSPHIGDLFCVVTAVKGLSWSLNLLILDENG